MAVTSVDPNPATPNQPAEKACLRPRRTLNRLVVALVGVAAGALGQMFFSQQLLWDGLVCYGLAVILFTLTLANRLYPDDQLPIPHPTSHIPHPTSHIPHYSPGLYGGWRGHIGVWLILLALGLSFLAFAFFGNPPGCFTCEEARPQAWWLYLVNLILLISGGLLLTRGASWGMAWRYLLPGRSITLGLAVVMGLALFMRLYHFSSQPFGIWFDEAEAGLQARQILQQPGYRPIFYALINVTGHLLAIYALALAWLGDTIYSLRLVSVLFGLGGVLAAYLFGRELRGPHFGLVLAFLLAVARWHVNFSRIAMTGIDTPFFEFLSLFFLLRLFRRGRLRDAIWAGLSLGFGLVFYTAFRLYLLALLVFALIATILWLSHFTQAAISGSVRDFRQPLKVLKTFPKISGSPGPSWRRRWLLPSFRDGGRWPHLGNLTVLLVSTWLVIVPLVRFALDNPDAFRYRTQEISILNRRDQADLAQALWTNTTKHLLMFNFKGDNNGRHNLPGEPMLDPAMGILAVLGLGLALARPRYPANAFFLILFPIALVGGIFSVDFEAPQSLRSIAVLPAVVYFAGLALASLDREAEAVLSSQSRLWLLGPAATLAGFMIIYNGYVYFERQANDFASWNAFSTPETIIGRKMAALGPDYLYYLSPTLTNHPTTRFLAPQVTLQRSLLLSDALPIREPPHRPAALFIHPDDIRVFKEAQRLYPQAEFETILGQAGDEPGPAIAYFVNLRPPDLAALQGLTLRYGPGQAVDRAGRSINTTAGNDPSSDTGRVPNLNVIWPDDLPPAIDPTEGFSAEWSGLLYAPRYGPYGFRLVTPGPGRLEIDGNVIFDDQGEQHTGLPLAQGNHTLQVQVEGRPGQVSLYWQPPGQDEELIPQWALYVPPVTNHGLLGAYYPNDRWEGRPAFQRIDGFLDTYFHLTPLDRPYTVEWTGSLDAPQAGFYHLGLRAVTEAQLFLDDRLLVTTAAPDQYTEAGLTLKAGRHDIRVYFKDSTDRSRIHLFWIPPGGRPEPIPSEYLWPPLGRYPEKQPAAAATSQGSPLSLNWLLTLGGPGSEPGRFFEPRDVAVLPGGELVVADTINRRVQILAPDGNPLQVLSGDEFPFVEPLAVAINSRQEILILDSSRQWLYRYDPAGHFLGRFGGPTVYLFHPRGLAVFEDDSLALADTGNGRLALFSADGAQAGNVGGLGSGPGQFNEPTDVLREAQGGYFVAEAMNNRIQHVDANGNPLGQWAIPPAYALNGPHLAFGPDGSILMTESQSHSLLQYATDGTLLNRWQSIGPVKFAAPVGLYYDTATHRLYVTDIWTHQVHIFEVKIGSKE